MMPGHALGPALQLVASAPRSPPRPLPLRGQPPVRDTPSPPSGLRPPAPSPRPALATWRSPVAGRAQPQAAATGLGRLLGQPGDQSCVELVRRKWAAFGRCPRRRLGRPPLPSECQQLILRLARENPGWGFRRIKGELRKLGYQVSATSIRGVLRRHRVPPAPRRAGLSWQRFLRAQAGAVLACDFFSVIGWALAMPSFWHR